MNHHLHLSESIRQARELQHVLGEIADEHRRARAKFGSQIDLPMGTSKATYEQYAERAKAATDSAAESGTLTWTDILAEEFFESLAEEEWALLRAELIQVAGVVTSMVLSGDHQERQRATHFDPPYLVPETTADESSAGSDRQEAA